MFHLRGHSRCKGRGRICCAQLHLGVRSKVEGRTLMLALFLLLVYCLKFKPIPTLKTFALLINVSVVELIESFRHLPYYLEASAIEKIWLMM